MNQTREKGWNPICLTMVEFQEGSEAPGKTELHPLLLVVPAPTLHKPLTHLIHSAQWGHIHSLPSHCPGSPNSCGVFPGATVDNGVHQDLERVLAEKGAISLTSRPNFLKP